LLLEAVLEAVITTLAPLVVEEQVACFKAMRVLLLELPTL
jgi:hypothetical protein